MAKEEIEERYLGDGVYAVFDGYYFRLDLRGQDFSTFIALEPAVFNALVEYRKDVYAKAGVRQM